MLDAARIAHLIAESAKCALELARHGQPSATDADIAARLMICTDCDQIERGHCRACGCRCEGGKSFLNKLAYKASSCPHPAGPKWLPIDDESVHA